MYKICFLSSMHPENDKRVFDKEALSLLAAGYQVTHLCPGKNSEVRDLLGVTTITYKRSSTVTSRITHFFNLFSKAKKVDTNVYHCNEVDSWMIAVLLKPFTGRKVVFDVHEHYPSTFAESRFPKVMRPMVEFSIRVLFKILTPFTDRIVLAKETVSKDFHCSNKKKILVRNFTQLSAIKFSDENKMSNEEVTMIHFGLIGIIRGWPQILEAMSLQKNKKLKLKVIGQFNDDSYPQFQERVKVLGLESRVEVLDWMPFEEAFSHLIKAQIGIIAFQPGIKNHTYAMPHKMFDYMAAGLAVLCPNFAVEVAPIVEKTGSGMLIDPSSAIDIAKKLDYLLDNTHIAKKMGVAGKMAVKETYNWESEVIELLKMYKELEMVK